MASRSKNHGNQVVSVLVGLMLVMGLVPTLAHALTPAPKGRIQPAVDKPALTIIALDRTDIYNGQIQGEGDTVFESDLLSYVTVSGLQGNDRLESVVIFYQGCDVGKTEVEVSSASVSNGEDPASDSYANVTSDYDINYVCGEYTITKATLTIIAKPQTYNYTGEPHGPAGTYTSGFDTYVEVSGLVGGDKLSSITLSGSQTNANVYVGEIKPSDAVVTYGHETDASTKLNYDVWYVPADLTIWGPPIEENVTLTPADVRATYDGAPHAAGAATITDKQGNAVNIEYQKADGTWTDNPSGITATNVEDSLTVNVRAWAPCYMGALSDKQLLAIDPRSVALTSASGTWTYDGKGHTKPEVTVGGDGFVAGEVSQIRATGSVTNVKDGAVDNAITFTEGAGYKAGNYKITRNEGTLSIKPAKATITVANASKVQGKADPSFKGTVSGLIAAHDLGEVFYKRTNSDENPGTYKGVLTAVYKQNDNYDVTVNNGDFTITKGSSNNTPSKGGSSTSASTKSDLPKTGDPLSGTLLATVAFVLVGMASVLCGAVLRRDTKR